MKHELINCDNTTYLWDAFHMGERWDVAFADPPDNIGLGYDVLNDKVREIDYYNSCRTWITALLRVTDTLWWSFNAKHTAMMGSILYHMCDVEYKPCVQVFTFGQHNNHDLGNNHRPCWRISNPGKCRLYPEQVKVPSWRELNGDKRAKPGGRVPGDVYWHPDDEVFDHPRVTGNSKQRRSFHPTQLHEDLVERCIKLTTKEGDRVLDPFGGTGTTLRVCKKINRSCTLLELSPNYCSHIAAEHDLTVLSFGDTA